MDTNTQLKYNTPVFKKDQPDDNYKFQSLPEPSGNYPYHLALASMLPFPSNQKLVFHMVGDTGSIRRDDFQRSVSQAMATQFQRPKKVDQPKFLFHLGDIVYDFGEAANYANQFFKTYTDYPGPIVAIAGNHDSDVNPASDIPYQSLDAFTTVFCDMQPNKVVFSDGDRRKSVTQPNVYWTLETPLANIIGLHTNVPKYGAITNVQRDWFVNELKNAGMERPDKALILCMHHAPYSADVNHGSSKPMIEFLESAFDETGVRPDIVFSGHVHNYQRFTKKYADGTKILFVVAGAGGYDELHTIAKVDDERFTNDDVMLKDVTLNASCDDKFGFLEIALERKAAGVELTGKYHTVRVNTVSVDTSLTDEFNVRVK